VNNFNIATGLKRGRWDIENDGKRTCAERQELQTETRNVQKNEMIEMDGIPNLMVKMVKGRKLCREANENNENQPFSGGMEPRSNCL